MFSRYLASQFPCHLLESRHFCKELVYRKNSLLYAVKHTTVFSCYCLSAEDKSGFCLPTGNQPNAHQLIPPCTSWRLHVPEPSLLLRPTASERYSHTMLPTWVPIQKYSVLVPETRHQLKLQKVGIFLPLEGANTHRLPRPLEAQVLCKWLKAIASALL